MRLILAFGLLWQSSITVEYIFRRRSHASSHSDIMIDLYRGNLIRPLPLHFCTQSTSNSGRLKLSVPRLAQILYFCGQPGKHLNRRTQRRQMMAVSFSRQFMLARLCKVLNYSYKQYRCTASNAAEQASWHIKKHVCYRRMTVVYVGDYERFLAIVDPHCHQHMAFYLDTLQISSYMQWDEVAHEIFCLRTQVSETTFNCRLEAASTEDRTVVQLHLTFVQSI